MKDWMKKYWGLCLCGSLAICFFTVFFYAMIKCEQSRPQPDLVLQREIFNECMRNLPEGPKSTVYNDWDEIISECRLTAYCLSLKK